MRLKLLVGVVFLSFTATTLLGQTGQSTLLGTVTDSSGAVVPGVAVTITDIGTNIDRNAVSDANGNYEAADLKPTTYRVRANRSGFKEFVADEVLLDAGQIRRLDITMAIGTTSQSVTVDAGAAVIQTDTGAVSGDLTAKKFNNVPWVDVYPSPLALMTTMPGVQGNGWGVVISGISDSNKQSWMMDGIANDTTGSQNDNPAFTEIVEVNTVNPGVDAARPTSFNMISKRGTDDFHFGGYYKTLNAGMNAIPYFTSYTPYIFTELEGEASGPIWKNKTFFFFGWVHQSIPLGSFGLATMPTDLERQGIFSQFATPIIDPQTGQPFLNNTIPQSRFSGVSVNVMNLYMPHANLGGPNNLTNNYGFYFPYNSDLYKGDWPEFRIDHQLTKNNSLYVRWMARITPYVNEGTTTALAWNNARDHRQLVASDTHVFSPALLNTFTFGHQTDHLTIGETEKGFVPLFGDDVVKAIGLEGVNQNSYHIEGFPQMSFSSISTLASGPGGVNDLQQSNGIDTYIDTITWNKGRHVIKVGEDYRHLWNVSGEIPTTVFGNFSFNGSVTGLDFADFLLGLPYSSTRLVNPIVNQRNTTAELGLFASDTFRVTPKLTIGYGLRYDYYASPTFDNGVMYNWNETTGNLVVAPQALSQVSSLYPKNITIVTGPVVPTPDKHNLRPRVSAAYSLTDKTVIRGAYGDFTESWGYFDRLLSGGPFGLAQTYYQTITNGTSLFSFPNPFPSLSYAATPSQSITGVPMKTVNGAIRMYNLTVEHDLAGLGLRASYIGWRGSGMNYSLNIDEPEASTIPWTPARNPYPQFTSTTVYRDDGSWHYDSLQLEVRKRVGAIIFDGSWTYSNSVSNYAIIEDPYNVTDRWTRDPPNRRNYFVISEQWPIPVGRGRQFLSNASRPLDTVVGGWALQGASTLATGDYFSPAFSGSDPSNTNTFGGLPDCAPGNGNISGGGSKTQWFNPAALSVPANGQFGNCGGNVLVGPGVDVHSVSAVKNFAITERFHAIFTGSVSDLFNHPGFNDPNNNISAPNPGQFTSVWGNYSALKQGFRQIGLKVRFEW